ncbi:recombinase family protein [Pseudomonas sp. 10B1]|uniref:recombinase family protein n=1 Tax=unclassified Pseudomonas TaxID=196821 RepID=UPI002B23DB20|nr:MULTISPECIES: recombinase family protein [unclassified Pseudomonas]MEA9996195.1 recombinase family protein [Pseudomonas sp. AA4]MEB0088919.1 recombinase family protein [Pseudomonas sp. RTI1]MEB0128029.1 recombinase family protein [Pseudomonas sp. CCC1.2]MEB0154921.1 recombinase family protein [Pseudomonas sp. CCC4.3]MEB0219811.1 recombinase family protein [Pseudomonas sp. AB12(2023)]
MKQAISYVRFSSMRQAGGNSVERQNTMIAKWLEQNPEYNFSELRFKDLGKSGSKGEHIEEGGGFAKLLEAVQEGAIGTGDVILVEAIDRAGRLEPLDMITLIIGPILKAGVTIITLDDNIYYTRESLTGPNIYLLVAKIQAAHAYSKDLSGRISRGYELRRDKARAGGGVKRMTPVWLTTEGQVIQRIAAHIKTAFELYVSGVGKATIAVRMRKTGVPELAKASGPGVDGWLRNQAARGYWNDIPKVYPAIVEPDLFFRAQQRGKEAKTTRPVKTAKHLLVGLVKCGHCGANFIMQNKDGRPHSMRCLNRQRLKDSGCDNSRTLPKPVLDYIRVATSLRAIETAFQRQQLTVNQKRILAIQSELETVTQKITALALAIQTVGSIPEVMSELSARTVEREALKAELLVQERTESLVDTFGAVRVEEDLLDNDPVKLNALLKGVDYRITAYADGLMIVNAPDEMYPWLYGGSDRTQKKYILHHLGHIIKVAPKPHLKMRVIETIDLDELNPLLQLLKREFKRQP